jgi:small nuclear ribonucleoprotein (snRNP)-like protein
MKYLLFALFLFWGQMAIAQTSDVKVSLRNGSIITGDLVEFDPLDHISLKIGNTNVTIPMTEVAYVDKPGQSSS